MTGRAGVGVAVSSHGAREKMTAHRAGLRDWRAYPYEEDMPEQDEKEKS